MTKIYVLILIEESENPYLPRATITGVYDSLEAADKARDKLGEWALSRARSGDETMRNARIEEHDVLSL